MDFTTAVKTAFHKYATFSGRATRSEYWFWIVFSATVLQIGSALDRMLPATTKTFQNIKTHQIAEVHEPRMAFYAIIVVALFIPLLAATVRRLHDSGHRGWWILLNFIPFIGPIAVTVFLCLSTNRHANRFGEPVLENLLPPPCMGFTQAIRKVFANFANFKGRATRSEYWWFSLFAFLAFMGSFILDIAFFMHWPHMSSATTPVDQSELTVQMMQVMSYRNRPIGAVVGLFLLLPIMSLLIRRVHDTGRSGYWAMICLLPFLLGSIMPDMIAAGGDKAMTNITFVVISVINSIGLLFIYAFATERGVQGANSFGPDPLEQQP